MIRTIELGRQVPLELKQLSNLIQEDEFDQAHKLLCKIRQTIKDINSINVLITTTSSTTIIEEVANRNESEHRFVPENMSTTYKSHKNIPFVHWISSFRGVKAIEFLLDEGFNINIIDKEGYTALNHVIINSYNDDIDSDNQQNKIDFLLNNGADTNISGQDLLGRSDYRKSPICLAINKPSILESILGHNSKLKDFQQDYSPFVKLAITGLVFDHKHSEDSLKLLLSYSDISVVTECFSYFANIFTGSSTESQLSTFHKVFNIFITSFGLSEKSDSDFQEYIQIVKKHAEYKQDTKSIIEYAKEVFCYQYKLYDKIAKAINLDKLIESDDMQSKILSYLNTEQTFNLLNWTIQNDPLGSNYSGGDEETKVPDNLVCLSGEVEEVSDNTMV